MSAAEERRCSSACDATCRQPSARAAAAPEMRRGRRPLGLPEIFIVSRRDFHVRRTSSSWEAWERFERLWSAWRTVSRQTPVATEVKRDAFQQAAWLLQDEDGGAVAAHGRAARAVARRAGRPGGERNAAVVQRGRDDRERGGRAGAAGRPGAELPDQRRGRADRDGGRGAVGDRGGVLGREGGGFTAEADEPRMIGQVQVTELANPEAAKVAILREKDAILATANALHPAMKARGGGAKDLEVRLLPVGTETHAIVHLIVDTQEA